VSTASARRYIGPGLLLALSSLACGCIEMALPPMAGDSGACSPEMRAGFLRTDPGSERADLWIAFVDVGHGDATWLRTPGVVGVTAGEVLVDAGDDGLPVAPYVPDGGRAVLELMQRAGLAPGDPLLAMVITHPDKDHYGGAAAVLAEHPARSVIHGGRSADAPTWRRLREAARAARIEWTPAPHVAREAPALDPWPAHSWGPGVDVRLVVSDRRAEHDNDASLVIELGFRGRRVLLMGDAGATVEAHIVSRVGPVDILRTGHHGGMDTSSPDFLDRVLTRSSHAIISAGRRDALPHGAVLDRLTDRRDTRPWRTDRADEGSSRRAAAGDDHIIARISGEDGRVEVCFLDPDPSAVLGGR